MDGTTDAPSSPGRLSGDASSGKTENRCYICERTYERLDHLNRHLKSHDNERAYKCPECDKGFNRADLLNRHRAAHARVSEGEHPMRKRTEKACQACIRAKTKCDEDRPCKRCRKRNLDCNDTEERRLASERSNSVAHSVDNQSSAEPALPVRSDPPTSMTIGGAVEPSHSSFAPSGDVSSFNNTAMQDNMGGLGFDFNYPDFFEQIMMPTAPGACAPESLMIPPDISNFTSDLDFSTVDFDFGTINENFGQSMGQAQPLPFQGDFEQTGGLPTPQSQAEHRSEAMKRSPWSWNTWIPQRGTHAFSGQSELDVREDRVNAADQLTSSDPQRGLHCALEYKARDAMIRVVTQSTLNRLSVSSFPSLQFLEDVLDVFLVQSLDALDSHIHAASLDANKARTELLLAMVARGTGFIALPPIWKMGLVLAEVCRYALGDVFEKDNSNTREIQAVQAVLLWIVLGVWSGLRRNTEISVSFLQAPITMLAWSNSMSGFRYKRIAPSRNDSEEELDKKWRAWAEQESWKRLVFHTFLHDSQVMLVHMKPPLISPAQMLLPVPAPRALWFAPDAQSWRTAYFDHQIPEARSTPSVLEIIGNPHLLGGIQGAVDLRLCQLLITHAIAHDVFEYRSQAQIFKFLDEKRRRDKGLAHMSKLRDLCEDLTGFLTFCENDPQTPPEIMFTIHFLFMSLYVSLDDVQLFSGRAGEEEARRIYPTIRTWTEDSESRIAIWHAGQVFRYARAFRRTTLRDFYAVAVYHAALSLWVWGMVTSSTSRRSGIPTPVAQSNADSMNTPMPPESLRGNVALDVAEDRVTRAFTQLGHGIPGVHSTNPLDTSRGQAAGSSTGQFCTLFDSRGVMSAAAGLLRSKFPQGNNGLPPLVGNLANLMDALA